MSEQSQTHHMLGAEAGQAREVTVHHSCQSAVQYDFYIPVSIWDSEPVTRFLQRLIILAEGATVSNGLTGVWHGAEEEIRIYRLIHYSTDRNKIRTVFQNELGELMARLRATPMSQEVILFTETEILMHLSKMPSP